MKIEVINDWQFLFSPHAIGGRFAAFTFFNLSWVSKRVGTDEYPMGGLNIVVLGLGLNIKGDK